MFAGPRQLFLFALITIRLYGDFASDVLTYGEKRTSLEVSKHISPRLAKQDRGNGLCAVALYPSAISFPQSFPALVRTRAERLDSIV